MDLLKIAYCVIFAALAILSGTATGQQAGGDQTLSITSTIPMRENPCPNGYVLVREKCRKVASRRCVDIIFNVSCNRNVGHLFSETADDSPWEKISGFVLYLHQ
jgi:hypothetical protein